MRTNRVVIAISLLLIAGNCVFACSSAAGAPSGSGIYGSMVPARGNAPANPPTYECVKVFDASGEKLIAKGECSGAWGSFSLPLAPGKYVVEAGGSWESSGGQVHFRPNRKAVQITEGKWIDMGAPKLPGPVQ